MIRSRVQAADEVTEGLSTSYLVDALLLAAGEGWAPRPAPEGVIPVVALDVRRAVALGLVPEAPARAAVIVADLASLRGAAP